MISPIIQNKLSLSWYLKPFQEFLCGDLGRIQIKHVGLFDLRCRLFTKDDCSVYTGRDYIERNDFLGELNYSIKPSLEKAA